MVHTVAPTLNVGLHANHMYSCHGEVVVLIFFSSLSPLGRDWS